MWCKKIKLLKVIGLVSLIMGFFLFVFFSTANAVLAKAEEKYTITEGDGDVYLKGLDHSLRFSGDGDDFDFTGLEIDSLAVDPNDYTLTGYPTIITLDKGFLDTLSEGLHHITMQWNDGIATGKFIVELLNASAGSDQMVVDSENGLTRINEINIIVNPPEVGKPMDFEILNYSSKPENAFKDFEVFWYTMEEGKRRQRYYPGAVFKPGVSYMVAVRADFDKDQFVAFKNSTVLTVNGQPADEKYSFVDSYYDYVGIAYIWEPLPTANNAPGGAGIGSTGDNPGDSRSPATGIDQSNGALPIALGCIGSAMILCLLLCVLRKKLT